MYTILLICVLFIGAAIAAIWKIKPWKNIIPFKYGYIVLSTSKTILELEYDAAVSYAKAFNLKCYDYFPHQELGYESPYDLCQEWSVINSEGQTIKYNEDFQEELI